MKGNRTGRLVATYGMLISLAFIFSYLEAVIPIPIPVPGVKLGLANLVTIVGLYTVGVKGTAAVSLIRIVLVRETAAVQHGVQPGRRRAEPAAYDRVSQDQVVQPDRGQHHRRDRA